MEEIFCNSISIGTHITEFVPDEIKSTEYVFQQEKIL